MTEVPAPPRGCPDPSILAAFVEGTLDAHSRREVERHVADCFECPAVIAETAQFLSAGNDSDEAESEPDPPPRGRWWLAIAAAVLALCTAGVWLAVVKRDPLSRMKEIVAESGTRPIEGQLAGFNYAPFPRLRSDRKIPDDLELRAEAERLSDSDSAHARGVALLLTRDVSGALRELETAVRLAPQDATAWNDLAAAHLAASEFARALTAADRAVAISSAFASAHFNRALALERLGRRDEAIRAYQRALDLDPQWREEITSHILQLQP